MLISKPKLMLLLATFTSLSFISNAQGWVTNGSNRLFPVNSSLSTSSVLVGVGTKTPSAQLHTTGTVRFQGLAQNDAFSRVMVTDTLGNVFYRSAATLGTGSGLPAWNLAGNAATIPGTNFIGTTDNQRLVFKTANTEQMTILPNGYVGLGTQNPLFKLHIHSTVPNQKLALTGTAPSLVIWGPTVTNAPFGAAFALATDSKQYSNTSRAGDLVIGPLFQNAIIFNTNINNPTSGPDEKMRIESNGNVGINAGAPTAKLHVNGSVRLENLPSGNGNTLVVDASGNVFVKAAATVSGATSSIQSNEVQALKSELAQLRTELDELKKLIGQGNTQAGAGNPLSNGTYLSANVPNPFNGETTISYALQTPAIRSATLKVSDLNGKLIKSYNLGNAKSGQIAVNGLGSSGTYVYSLEVDGRVLESRKMTLVK